MNKFFDFEKAKETLLDSEIFTFDYNGTMYEMYIATDCKMYVTEGGTVVYERDCERTARDITRNLNHLIIDLTY